MDTLVKFSGLTVGEVSADKVLEDAAAENMAEVVVIGTTTDGELYYASSERDERTLYLIEHFKAALMGGLGRRGT